MSIWPFRKKPNNKFEISLRKSFDDLNADLPDDIWSLISWLETNGQCFQYRNNQKPFLAVSFVRSIDALWSHVVFEMVPDLVRHWFGEEGLEQRIIPFIRCGADGSYIALWKEEGEVERFVFLGSEGEAFVIAEDSKNLVALITMGYMEISGRDVFGASPEQNWQEACDTDWPDLTEVKTWAVNKLGVHYPKKGADILPYSPEDDPFSKFVTKKIHA